MEKTELDRLERSVHKLLLKCAFMNLQDVEIHPGQMQFMGLLLAKDRCTQTELAKKLGISNASVGISVRRLEKAGLVKKSTDQSDLRATNIELTEKGRSFAVEAKKRVEEVLSIKYKGLTEKQIEDFHSVMIVINDNIQNYYNGLKG